MKGVASFFAGAAILAVGGGVLLGLNAWGRSRAVEPAKPEEPMLHVRAAQVQPGNYPVTLSAFGEVKPRRAVGVAAEVPGKVIALHPECKTGGRVKEGEVLFRLDPQLYATQLAEAEAGLRQQEAALERLKHEQSNAHTRAEAMEQTAQLSERSLERAKQMMEKGIGAPSDVDVTESSTVEARSQRDLARQEAETFPVRIREVAAALDAARAAVDTARQSLERTEVKAPFSGRIAGKQIDLGQFVAAGMEVAQLADDTVLEITLPLESREARAWLQFEDSVPENAGWFPPVQQVDCSIRWTEDPQGSVWTGRLDRIANYDPASRTVQAVAAYTPGEHDEAFPLVAGMFCRVDIPGRALEGVFRLPHEAVTFDDHVYTVADGRLKAAPVVVAREEGAFTYVREGIAPGDTVVVTRLVDALDNTLLQVDMTTMESLAAATLEMAPGTEGAAS